MGKAYQPAECLEAIYSIAHFDSRDLEPSVDWPLGLVPDCDSRLLDMD